MLQTKPKSVPFIPVTHNAVRYVSVTVNDIGQRLDNFLLRILKGVPKSFIYRIVRRGEVRINSGRVTPDRRLQADDLVRIPPLRQSPAEGAPFRPSPQLAAQLKEAVLYEDRDVLVIDKPAGLAVHKGTGIDFGVIEALRGLRSEETFLELAHRLDRETSGCLVLAKTAIALRQIQEAFRDGHVQKRYLTLVCGYWNFGPMAVNQPLGRTELQAGERKMTILESGKTAISHFRPVNLTKLASLLEVKIATGRTHQIRVHAAHMGHPVAGDDTYGDADFNRTMTRYGLHRLFLHAHSLIFPLGAREIAVSAPLSPDLKKVLSACPAPTTPHKSTR